MLTIMVATLIAICLAGIVLMKSRNNDPAQLEQPRNRMLTVGVQIICGNCSGLDDRPVKTYLDHYGNCSSCGGSSYLLASSVGMNIALMRADRVRATQIVSGHGRVIPFETPASRASRSDRIAV